LAGEAGDPVEGGVGEDSVKLVVVGEGGGVVLFDCKAGGAIEGALAGRGEHGGGGIDAGDDGSGGGELFGESTIAAAEVEYALAGLWSEKGDDAGGERGYEATVGGVGFSVPGLGAGGFHRIIFRLWREMSEEDKNL